MRHAPFAVTPAAKERWLVHFRAGLDAAGLTPEQDAQFWDYVTHAAQFMVNTFDEPDQPSSDRESPGSSGPDVALM
jgi:hemoglobin